MEHKLKKLFLLMVLSFVVLAIGEYVLYRKVMLVNKMVSEGLMQIKEVNQMKPTPEMRILK